MRILIAVLLTLLALPAQALTKQQVQDKADQRLQTLWVNVIRPGELAWFAARGEYGQCLHTRNVPANEAADAAVRKLLPVTNVEDSHHLGMTCKAIFGAVNIDVELPFAVAVHVYNGPQGHGFVGIVEVKFDGTRYTKRRNYGPETHRTRGWEELIP